MNDLLNLQQRFNDCLFRIPDYQRGYSWTDVQLEEFWSDLVSLLINQDHYTGMLSLKEVSVNEIVNNKSKWNDELWLINAGYKVYEVVDGQQRLTTIIILINEIISYCKKNKILTLGEIPIEEIEEKYLYKVKISGIYRTYKFGYEADNPSDKYFRKEILGDLSVGDVDETFYTLNLKKAKDFFKKKLDEFVNGNVALLENIYNKLVLHLKFNMYYINDDFNVYVAFETMNNRGKGLSSLELLKNRLIYLSTLFDDENEEKNNVRNNINDTWKTIYGYLGKDKDNPLSDDEFLRDHWIIYFGYHTRQIGRNLTIPFNVFLLNKYFIQQNIDSNNLYIPNLQSIGILEDDVEFVSSDEDIDNRKISLTLNDIQSYVNSLKELIPYWYEMKCPNKKNENDISKYLVRLNLLGHVNDRPLITVLLSKSDISYSQKVQCLKNIERFNFLHYKLNNYNSTWSNSIFYNLARDLYSGLIDINYVLENTNNVDFLSKNNVIVSNGILDKFKRFFKREGFYSWINLKYILYIYDLSFSETLSEQQLNVDEYFKQDSSDFTSIEHIYPRKALNSYWEDKFREYDGKLLTDSQKKSLSNSLGNLLPLSKKINSSLQNYSFDEKKKRYQNGSKSELMVSRNDEWTPLQILARGLDIVAFLENEFDFKFSNKAEKMEFLGLDFMIDENDKNIDVIIPEIEEKEDNIREISFDEEMFEKLTRQSSSRIMEIHRELDEFIMSLDENIKKNTTTVYLSYVYNRNFIEEWFQNKSLKYVIMTGDYDDPEERVQKLAESYRWANDNCLIVYEDDDLEYAKNILRQSFEKAKL